VRRSVVVAGRAVMGLSLLTPRGCGTSVLSWPDTSCGSGGGERLHGVSRTEWSDIGRGGFARDGLPRRGAVGLEAERIVEALADDEGGLT